MLPKRILQMLTFFDACGYNTGSSRLSQNRKVAILIQFVHFSLAVFFSLCIFYLTIKLPTYSRFVELLNQLLQYSTATYTYWFIIFDSLFRWQEHKNFWRILQQIDQSIFPQCDFTIRLYLLKFIQYIFTTFVSVSIILLINEATVIHLTLIHLVPIKLCQIRIFYYMFCLEIVYIQLKVIERELMRMKQMPHIDLCRFQWLREYYHSVYEMSNLLNQIFDWSHLAAVSFCFHLLLTELNWFSVNFHQLRIVPLIGS